MKTKHDFIEIINRHNYKTGLEVGVREGNYCRYLLANTSMVVYGIDPWTVNAENSYPDSCLRQVAELKFQYLDRFVDVRGTSPAEAANYEDNFFDFIHIDALHDYESVKNDLAAWWPKLKVGGLFTGHDFISVWPDVVRAVEEFCNNKQLKFSVTTELDDQKSYSWYLHK